MTEFNQLLCYRCHEWPCRCSDGQTLLWGDCRVLLPQLPPVDLVLTDPPYGVGYSEWDKEIPHPQEWLYPLFSKAETILVTPGNANFEAYPRPRWVMAWFRPGSTQRGRAGGFHHWEPILAYGKYRFDIDAKQFAADTKSGIESHPCAKPLALFSWLATGSKTTGDILDPFMGSGTTSVAAKRLGRRCIGIEIEEKYVQVAANRLRQSVIQFDATQQPPQPVPANCRDPEAE